jgi:hypothetical protein
MVKLAHSMHPWISLSLLALFCVVAYALNVRDTLIVANSLLLVISGTVAAVYLPKAVKAMRERRDPAVQHISYGIVLGWGDTFLWRVLIMIWLLTDQKKSILVNNDILSGMYAGAALGAFYHLTSPGAMARGLWPRVIACAVVVAMAVVLSAVLILIPPDLTWLVDRVEPFIPR